MGLTSRREKVVLFGDSLTQRSMERGGWGESLVRAASLFFFSSSGEYNKCGVLVVLVVSSTSFHLIAG